MGEQGREGAKVGGKGVFQLVYHISVYIGTYCACVFWGANSICIKDDCQGQGVLGYWKSRECHPCFSLSPPVDHKAARSRHVAEPL